jgi:type I restriction enzyme S subunit
MQDKIRPGYKQTEVGVIPEDWGALRVADLGGIVTGGTPSTFNRSFWNGAHPWVTPTDISGTRDIFTSDRLLSIDGLHQLRELPVGSVLVTCIASIGKNAILRVRGGCNQQINAGHLDFLTVFAATA